jgi:hypothetical protein
MAGKVFSFGLTRLGMIGRRAGMIAVALSVLTLGGFGQPLSGAYLQSGAALRGGSPQESRPKADLSDAAIQREQLKSSIPLKVNALNRFDTHCSDWDWDPDLPIPARELITSLKHQLRDLITLTLQANPDQEAAELKQGVLSQLSSIGINIGEPEDSNPAAAGVDCRFPYGAIYKVEVERPNQANDLIAVTTSLGVVCGEDTSLYVFERKGCNFQLVLARESNGYEDVSGAQGRFQYAISPRDRSDRYFVVSADVSPWCSSNWQAIRYRLERPGSSPSNPAVIASGEGTTFLQDGAAFALVAAVDSARLEYYGEFRNDGGRLARTHVLSYLVRGDQVTRVAPIALSPEDFVDEWMTLPWEAAAEWVSKSNIENIKLWHENLEPVGQYASLGEVDFIRQCSDDKWQVGMSVWNPEDYRGQLPETLYFTVGKKDGAYYMERVDTMENSVCH